MTNPTDNRFIVLTHISYARDPENYRIGITPHIHFRVLKKRKTSRGKYKGTPVLYYADDHDITPRLIMWGLGYPVRSLHSCMIIDKKTSSISVFNVYQVWDSITDPVLGKIYNYSRILFYNHLTMKPIIYAQELPTIAKLYAYIHYKVLPNLTLEILEFNKDPLCNIYSCPQETTDTKRIPLIIPRELAREGEKIPYHEPKTREEAKKIYNEMKKMLDIEDLYLMHERKNVLKNRLKKHKEEFPSHM